MNEVNSKAEKIDAEKIDLNKSLLENTSKGDLNEIIHVINTGAQINYRNDSKRSPIIIASRTPSNFNEIIKFLLTVPNIDINLKDIMGRSALHYSSRNGNYDIVKLLLNNGADVNSKDCFEKTPMHYTAAMGFVNLTLLLIDHKANLFLYDNKQKLPIDYAIQYNNMDIINIIETESKNINLNQDNKGDTDENVPFKHSQLGDEIKSVGTTRLAESLADTYKKYYPNTGNTIKHYQFKDAIEANWKNYGKYYPGIIHKYNGDNTYTIIYDDTELEENVPFFRIRHQKRTRRDSSKVLAEDRESPMEEDNFDKELKNKGRREIIESDSNQSTTENNSDHSSIEDDSEKEQKARKYSSRHTTSTSMKENLKSVMKDNKSETEQNEFSDLSKFSKKKKYSKKDDKKHAEIPKIISLENYNTTRDEFMYPMNNTDHEWQELETNIYDNIKKRTRLDSVNKKADGKFPKKKRSYRYDIAEALLHLSNNFKVGDTVESNYKNKGTYYPGVIIKKNQNQSYDILYDHTDELETNVFPKSLSQSPRSALPRRKLMKRDY